MIIEQSVKKDVNQVDFKIHRSGNGSGSGGGSSVKSNVTCHKCGKKGHIHKYCRSKVTASSDNPHNKSANELAYLVTKKPVVLDTKYLTTANTTCNNKR